ncbi:MAG: hypothetical protein HFI89_06320 [Lachnospiraceae bacterium]|nr:hypothetical protein [Lachnospiraceae bacterium]
MKLIRITTDNIISTHDFPEGNYAEQNKVLRDLIGNNCRIYEHVMPERLYTELNMAGHPTKVPGQCVSMLIDEEGRLKENEPNLVGSYLYMTDRHGCPIMGNILFVGEEWGREAIDFCGIEDSVFKDLEQQLSHMIGVMEKAKEVFGV